MNAKKTKQPGPRRVCRVTLRLTENEHSMFKKKAGESFNGNVSRMIVNAVVLFKNDRLASKYSMAKRFSDLYNELLPELKKSGTNLNQVAHQLNAAMLQYMGQPPTDKIRVYLDKRLDPVLLAHAKLLVMLKTAHDKVLNDVVKEK